jgi:DNA-binding NarL/FixJ family response regulator
VVATFIQEVAVFPEQNAALLTRMSSHLSAAYRIRKKLASTGALQGAAAILGAGGNWVHGTEAVDTAEERTAILDAAVAQKWARGRDAGDKGLEIWTPRVEARWTLAQVVDTDGKRFVAVHENPSGGLTLREVPRRERQVLAYFALGYTSKETAYALGIADSTVRVLLSRAVERLGFANKEQLLTHPEVAEIAARRLKKG